MNLDSYGLPVQADGDANDQLQRVGMIATAGQIAETTPLELVGLWFRCSAALASTLQPKPGIYVRHIGGDPTNVSADQLISVLAYWVASGNVKQVAWMAFRMFCRLGFAQNYVDGLNVSTKAGTNAETGLCEALPQRKWKLPDFMLLRALPLFTRAHWLLWPVALLSDLWLVLGALASRGPVWRDGRGLSKRGPDDVDDNLTILTLAVCRARYPTPLSWLAAKLYAKLRPWNNGCIEERDKDWRDQGAKIFIIEHSPVYGALRWYHRAEAGGNPEIAELWKPIIERFLS